MKFTIQVVQQKSQPILFIRKTTSIEKLPELIGENYRKLFDYMGELQEIPVEPPYTAYYNMDMQNLDVEMGLPVKKGLTGNGEIDSGEIPAGSYVSRMYSGPYAGLEKIYAEMTQWIKDNGYEATGVSYEYYYNSPADVEEKDLLTRIAIPIKDE